jgi:hypothetical protein
VIVRIFGEGQYRLPGDSDAHLEELDQAYVNAVEAEDEAEFATTFQALLAYVRSNGERLADDELEPSDVMLPPADTSLEEARTEFSGEGLIPE